MTVPNAITFGRLLLGMAAAYVLFTGNVTVALGMFAIAWALDAIDGLIARRINQATAFGYIFDKIVDRVLLIGAVVVLLRRGAVPPITALVLTKDIATLPAFVIALTHRERIADLGRGGKILTLLQGLAILWIALTGLYATPISLGLAASGLVMGGRYVYRVVYQK